MMSLMTAPTEPSRESLTHALAHERAKARELEQALGASRQIGMAMGILMERYRIPSDAAFAVLQRHSQAANVKLRHVAAQLAQTGVMPGERDAERAGAEDEVVPRPRG
jgi:AmiR/NasT family two-component response regulator